MKRLIANKNLRPNDLQNFNEFRKWLLNSQYKMQLKEKFEDSWSLISDFNYEGSAITPLYNLYQSLIDELNLDNFDHNHVLKRDYKDINEYIDYFMNNDFQDFFHDMLLES